MILTPVCLNICLTRNTQTVWLLVVPNTTESILPAYVDYVDLLPPCPCILYKSSGACMHNAHSAFASPRACQPSPHASTPLQPHPARWQRYSLLMGHKPIAAAALESSLLFLLFKASSSACLRSIHTQEPGEGSGGVRA